MSLITNSKTRYRNQEKQKLQQTKARMLCDPSDGSYIVNDLVTKQSYRHDNYDGASKRYSHIVDWYRRNKVVTYEEALALQET